MNSDMRNVELMREVRKSLDSADADLAYVQAQAFAVRAEALAKQAQRAKDGARRKMMIAWREYRKTQRQRGCLQCQAGLTFNLRWQWYVAAFKTARLAAYALAPAREIAPSAESAYALAVQCAEDAASRGEFNSNDSDKTAGRIPGRRRNR